MKIFFTAFFAILSVGTLWSQRYSSSNLYPVYGQENIENKQDFSATTELLVEDNRLVLIVTVQDDEYIQEGDLILKDHVEIWLQAGPEPQAFYHYEDDFEGGLYSWRQNATKDSIPAFCESLGESMSWEAAEIEPANVSVKKDFTGMVHYGIGQHQIELFDAEMYHFFDLPIENKNLVKHEFRETEMGWIVVAYFPMESLVFLKKTEINTLNFSIDVFDKDSDGLSVLSTRQELVWGQTDHFVHLDLKHTPLKIEAQPGWNLMNYVEWPGYFLSHDGEDWEFYYWNAHQENWWDEAPSVELASTQLDYHVVEMDGHTIERLTDNGATLQYAVDGIEVGYHGTPDTLSLFHFPDGTLGVIAYNSYMQNPWGRGPCGACEHSNATFLRLDQQQQPLLHWDTNEGMMETRIEVDTLWQEFEMGSLLWEWKKEGETLLLYQDKMEWQPDSTSMSKTYEIGWNEKWEPQLLRVDSIQYREFEKKVPQLSGAGYYDEEY